MSAPVAQEPVAWITQSVLERLPEERVIAAFLRCDSRAEPDEIVVPLYAVLPQAQGLTDADILDIRDSIPAADTDKFDIAFARAILSARTGTLVTHDEP